MTVILVRDPALARFPEEDDDGFWPLEFDRSVDGQIEDVLAEYDVVIPADDLRVPPRLNGGARVALYCARFEALRHLASTTSDFDIVFSPSFLSRLDRHRALRVESVFDALVVAEAQGDGGLLGELTLDDGRDLLGPADDAEDGDVPVLVEVVRRGIHLHIPAAKPRTAAGSASPAPRCRRRTW